jgi:phosphomannomutase
LLIAEMLCVKDMPLSKMVAERIEKFPSSGEINSKLDAPKEAINRVLEAFKDESIAQDFTDGISMEFTNWRFSLRSSNTEPVVRLNVESRGDIALMREKTAAILAILRS